MDEIIFGIFNFLSDFALEVWFSIPSIGQLLIMRLDYYKTWPYTFYGRVRVEKYMILSVIEDCFILNSKQ